PKIEADAGEDQRDQDQRNGPPEETRAEDRDGLLKRVLGDLAEDDADDERRARPIVALEQIAQASHHHDQDQVLPVAAEQVAPEQREHQDVGNEEARLHGAELADPGAGGDQHDNANDVGDDEGPDQRPDDVDVLGQHGRPGLNAEHQEGAEHD